MVLYLSDADVQALLPMRTCIELLERFDVSLRRLWFDTVLYNAESLELLFKVVGTDRCLFGSDKPANGSVVDPETGRALNDIRPLIEAIPWLTPRARADVCETNARQLFTRLPSAEVGNYPLAEKA
jgi:4-oxalmesaconate hydratase